jgi:hypothetical protein
MFDGSGLPSGFHSDVLNAEQPADAAGVERLTTEIKGRAAASLKSGNYPEAVALYSKAIEVNEAGTNDASTVSILYANRSMCQLRMKKVEEALQDANIAAQRDPTYVKGYFRKASALTELSRFGEAKVALEQGLAIKPDDKELRDQLVKISVLGGAAPSSPSTAPKSQTTTAAAAAAAATSSTKKVEKTETTKDDEDDEEDKGGAPIRGYKKKSDGRTTSFFDHELDAQTAALIGDIAPKKVDATTASVGPTKAGSSAWNQAGTFESRSETKWCTQRLSELLETVESKRPEASIRITSVESVTGDAEVVSNRGKRKFIMDFSVKINWLVTSNTDTSCVAKGALLVADITADEDFEIGEVTTDGVPASLQSVVQQHVKSDSGSLAKEIRSALTKFCSEFKAK